MCQNMCHAVFSYEAGIDDKTSCLLPDNHEGPHEFQDQHGVVWLWETDWECTCEHCMRCEGDYCTIYWEKSTT